MPNIIIVGIFCEDIREDAEGLFTLVRVFPDTVILSSFPNMLRSLAFYLRVNVERSFEPTPVRVVLRVRGQQDMPLTILDVDIIQQAQAEAVSQGLPFGTIVTTAAASGFPVSHPDRVSAVAIVGEAEVLCGTLKFEAAADVC